MHTLLITPHLLKASMLVQALKNHNLHCSLATPQSLTHQWTPDTDAVIFPHLMDSEHMKILPPFFHNVHKKTPFIFFNPADKRFFRRKELKRYLRQCIFLDESLPLTQIPLLIREILQKNSVQGKEVKLGPITIDRINRTLHYKDDTVILSKKEFFLLELLLLNSGRVTTRENIIDYVWDKRDYVSANTIDVYISRLRKKLSPTPTTKSPIETYPCLGYQLNL